MERLPIIDVAQARRARELDRTAAEIDVACRADDTSMIGRCSIGGRIVP